MRLKTVILSLPAAVLLIGLGLASPVMAQGPTPPNDPGRIEVITSGSFAAALNVLGPLYDLRMKV
jgi:hypothetical protein